MSYELTIHIIFVSWIKGINGPLFNQTLNYQETLEGTTPCYNGNISRMCWRSVEMVWLQLLIRKKRVTVSLMMAFPV